MTERTAEMTAALFWIVPFASLVALSFAAYFYRQMIAKSEGNETMRKIAAHVRSGALAYLKQQYKVVGIIFLGITALFAWMAFGLDAQNHWMPFAFLTGGLFSALAGFFGMKTATAASARTAEAARHSLDASLRIAFRSGAVMGLVVVGLALLHISIWFVALDFLIDDPSPQHKLVMVTTTLLTFGMGASLQALFARVGGGIFTKAADVGADLVGKVEAGIPEDDPRNPATIADNVGDNVGDVAGMGADLYESYCGSILATAALGAAAYSRSEYQFESVIAPMMIGAAGAILSIIGIFCVRVKEGASSADLLKSLNRGITLSGILIVIASWFILWTLGIPNAAGLWGAIVTGLVTGIVIGKTAEYSTSQAYRPTQRIAGQAKTGPATVIVAGLAEGMLSVVGPVLAVVVGTALAFCLASGSAAFSTEHLSQGLYGIGLAAVGMLSTLGITLATDAYGPIADNAGGNAEMSHLPPEVRARTDALDALGNTTAASGKGFAIGSAALTALALLAAYLEEIRITLLEMGVHTIGPPENAVSTKSADLVDFMTHFEVHLMNPKVLLGAFIGSMMTLLFCGLTMNAVGRAAAKMVEEVRRQFRESPGILSGGEEPDYARCVTISTVAAQKEMLAPAFIAILAPVLMGLLFGPAGVMGLLAGALTTGFAMAVFMANAGGAWDNAKKYIEEGNLGGKGSKAHQAAVIGDTVGDPFKDTSGPSLNILIKLMSMVAIVTASVTLSFSFF